jgi:dTDP-4-amino-4,6-dideoxygalactose transaminase
MEPFKNKVLLSSPTMHGEEMEYVKEAYDSGWVTPLGKNVDEFEREVTKYLGIKDAAATVSGTSALHCAVKLAGVKQGSIVLCSDLTFAATVNPVSYENGTQVFIDSERDTWNMNHKALKKAFEKYNGIDNPKPTAVVLAHLYGTPAKIDEIREICESQNVPLIEDAAESLGATYKGVQTGNFGNWAAISFNGNKIITSSGGGMFLSNDNESAKKVRFWCTQSREPYPWYQHEELGYNYRMSNIVAGIGIGQMKHLDEHKAIKREIYEYYKQGLSELPVEMNPYDEENSQPNFWLSCMTINKGVDVKPMTVIDTLKEYNAEARPIWKPMHMQPLYKNNDFITVDNDNVGEDIFARGLCLPSDIKMTREEQSKVVEIIKSCFK